MSISTILSMASAAEGCRRAVAGSTFAELEADAARGAQRLRADQVGTLVYLGANSPALPRLLFSAAGAGIPFAPLNYRLPTTALANLLDRLDAPMVVTDPEHLAAAEATGRPAVTVGRWFDEARAESAVEGPDADPDSAAVLLFTSGTTAEPKCVVLRHAHLLSYILGTVEFASAAEHEAALVCVPPYHVAGIGSALSNFHACRRIVHLPDFHPARWLRLAREEEVTNAMVVPTMLSRIVEHLDGRPADCPSLASLAYGGARMPLPVLETALRAFPDTAFTNAYGLTETSSTIAVLGPDDHRAALDPATPHLRGRLASVGRLVPGLEARIVDPAGGELGVGTTGELQVRGPQVSGEYRGAAPVLDAAGWFPTRDLARIDRDGYLYLEGRADDVVIRGGENIAPAEVEDALLRHESVGEAAVVGVPDDDWGQRLVAVVVPRPGAVVERDEIREHVRALLRGSRTPDEVVVRDELPHTATGKVVRRLLVDELADPHHAAGSRP